MSNVYLIWDQEKPCIATWEHIYLFIGDTFIYDQLQVDFFRCSFPFCVKYYMLLAV